MKKIVFLFSLLIVLMTLLCSCSSDCAHARLSGDSCGEPPTCLDCGSSVGKAPGHKTGEWITVKEATKTEDGYMKLVCERCGELLDESVLYATGSVGLEYKFSKDQNACTVVGIGTCTDEEIYIPKTVEGRKVRMIGKCAFENCDFITSVHIPDTVFYIDERAFSGCTGLTEIVLPDGVEQIHERAFWGCSGITEITIPSSVTSIRENAFYDCTSLSTVYYNSEYGNKNYAVWNLKNLKKIVFGGKTVPAYILSECTNINEVIILDSVREIGESAFYSCWGIDNITIPDSVETIGANAFAKCNYLTEIVLPDSVKTIGIGAFSDCLRLVSVKLPSGLSEISDKLFDNCKSLSSITIPDGVVTVGGSAFGDCTSLTEIIIPDSVTHVYSSFYGCENIKSIYVGSGLVGDFAFSGIDALETVVVDADNTVYRSENNCVIEIATNALALGTGAGVIPDGVTAIKKYAFREVDTLKSIIVPESVTLIEDSAFSYCDGLVDVIIKGNVLVGSFAFEQCSSLEALVFEGEVLAIGERAFAHCESLLSVTVSKSAGDIGKAAFQDCVKLKRVELLGGVENIGSAAFNGCKELDDFYIGGKIKYIYYNAFDRADKLERIRFGGTLEEWNRLLSDFTLSAISAVKEIVCSDGSIKLDK